MGRKVTEDEIKEWLALKKRGYTNRAIGEKFDRDEKTIGKYLRPYLGKRGEVSPQDSELDTLERQKERYQVLIELDKLREEREGLPKRLEGLEAELKDVKTTLEALSADQNQLHATLKKLSVDQDQLRELFQSLPISNLGRNWKCSQCGSSKYVMVKVECSKCGHETTWGYACPKEEKVTPYLY